MKKIVSLLLCISMLCASVMALASCGGQDDSKIVVAMSPDFAPMEFYDTAKKGDEAIVGFDVLLSNYIAKELGKELIIKPMDFDACMMAVQTGTADLAISGFSWTAARAETFLITDYYVAGENETEQVVITTAANAGKFKTAADFNGKKVAAQGGSLQELLVTEQLVPAGATLVKYTGTNEALEALKGGIVDAFAVAKGNGDAFIASSEGAVDFSGFDFFVEEKYKNNVILVNKENEKLFNDVNGVLAKAMAAGLYQPWYEACELYAGVKTLDALGYDANGNKIVDGEPAGEVVATSEDLAKKVAYETFYNEYTAD